MKENKKYIKRISDQELQQKLGASGALLIRGIKACGKTESAKQFAGSFIAFDQNEQAGLLMDTDPKRLLFGETPRLIDEWQVYPNIWNYVRHEVDERNAPAQFILTGSSHPEEDVKMHSGAGRFTILDMRTMSWQEMGFSTGKIKLKSLFDAESIQVNDHPQDLEFIVERLIIGGFPSAFNKSLSHASAIHRAYVELLTEVDMSRVSQTKRRPDKVRNLLRSLARNTATMVDISALEMDIRERDRSDLSRPSIYDYLEALERLMVIENQPAWNTHIRSTASLRKSPKRHFADVSLAIAALGAEKDTLLNDLKFCGFLFESLVIHDLRVYAQANDAKVFHYNDSSGIEVDAIVQKFNGDWCAFEIKLGVGQIDEAAGKLLKFSSAIDRQRTNAPKSLNIITGIGQSYTRKDGINVISLASLGF